MADFTLHDLRDAYAVDFLRRNPTKLRRLSQHLGHSAPSTTERHYIR